MVDSRAWLVAAASAMIAAACAAPPRPAAPMTAAPAPVAEPEPTGAAQVAEAAAAKPVESSAPVAAGRPAFSTRHAHFEPARFSDLPGWRDDSLGEAWAAFRQSCKALAKRPAWAGPCARTGQVDAASEAQIRAFLEREFVLYQIFDADRSPAGTVTGYYEPMVNGSRQPGGNFTYPVLGPPEDLLLLDAKSLPADHARRTAYARVNGSEVKVAPGAGPGLYAIVLGNTQPDVRDGKVRVRIEGNRIVPYFARGDIERGLARAPTIAWVDNPMAVYIMQIQGSGKIRLPDGKLLRLAFAEQNGQPFQPPVRPATRGLGDTDVPLIRGLALADFDAPASAADEGEGPRTRGLGARTSAPAGGKRADSPEVDAVVDALLGAATPPAKKSSSPAKPAPAAKPAAKPGAVASAKSEATVPPATQPDPAIPFRPASYFASDPSFVFFREIPDSPAGPVGALGVPLTPGRSIAVDPRVTPMGFPVFLATRKPDRSGELNRLMLAQDTGGAIRGAVRADYFWGFGPGAGAQAARMKHEGRMWLLWPKDQPVTVKAAGLVTRGLGNAGGAAECTVPDPEYCAE